MDDELQIWFCCVVIQTRVDFRVHPFGVKAESYSKALARTQRIGKRLAVKEDGKLLRAFVNKNGENACIEDISRMVSN